MPNAVVAGAPNTAAINYAIDGRNIVIVPSFIENLDKSSFI
jgi:hypothetical protein